MAAQASALVSVTVSYTLIFGGMEHLNVLYCLYQLSIIVSNEYYFLRRDNDSHFR